jgi:hypothetical protein
MKLIDIVTGLEVTGKNVFSEYPGPFRVEWGANVWEPVIHVDNVEGKIQYVRWQRYYYDKRSNARDANVTHEVGQYGRVR